MGSLIVQWQIRQEESWAYTVSSLPGVVVSFYGLSGIAKEVRK